MIKVQQYIPLHLAVALVLGILLGNLFPDIALYILWIILGISSLWVLFSFNKPKLKFYFQLGIYLWMTSLGYWLLLKDIPQNDKRHFSHYNIANTKKTFQVLEVMKPSAYQQKYLVAVKTVGENSTKGKLLVYAPLETKTWEVGEVFSTFLEYEKIPKPINPHTFDYAQYMQRKEVYFQMNFPDSLWIKAEHQPQYNMMIWASHFRDKLQERIEKYNWGEQEFGVLNALVLGDKQYISQDIRGAYAGAGAVHLLAVSGLHVGVIFLLLSFLMTPLEKIKNGKTIKAVVVIGLLWLYALIAGGSGSVVRAVTMFSFISIGMGLRGKRSSIWYSLFTSFLVLLLINPRWLFEVGFQLSYLAVGGIVLFEPLITKVFPSSKNKVLRKVWQLLGVSIGATLGTFPLSLYYFHQFPGLFFLSNLLIVPTLSIILGLGILVVVLAYINLLPNVLVEVLNVVLATMNSLIQWIASQETFLIKNISFSGWKVLSAYYLIGALYLLIKSGSQRRLAWFFMGIIVLQAIFVMEKWHKSHHNELIVFHQTARSHIGIQRGDSLYLLSSHDSITNITPYFIKDYNIAKGISNMEYKKLNINLLKWNNQSIMLIDSAGIYEGLSIRPDYLLLRDSPKIHLEMMLDSLRPKILIADGSNYKLYVKKWKETCHRKGITFHYTGTDGAFELD